MHTRGQDRRRTVRPSPHNETTSRTGPRNPRPTPLRTCHHAACKRPPSGKAPSFGSRPAPPPRRRFPTPCIIRFPRRTAPDGSPRRCVASTRAQPQPLQRPPRPRPNPRQSPCPCRWASARNPSWASLPASRAPRLAKGRPQRASALALHAASTNLAPPTGSRIADKPPGPAESPLGKPGTQPPCDEGLRNAGIPQLRPATACRSGSKRSASGDGTPNLPTCAAGLPRHARASITQVQTSGRTRDPHRRSSCRRSKRQAAAWGWANEGAAEIEGPGCDGGSARETLGAPTRSAIREPRLAEGRAPCRCRPARSASWRRTRATRGASPLRWVCQVPASPKNANRVHGGTGAETLQPDTRLPRE